MCHRERRGWLVHIPRSTEVRGKLLNSCRRERSVSHEPVIRTAKSVSAAGQNQSFPRLRPSFAKSRPLIFYADCELDHIHPRIIGARCSSPDGASRFQCPGWQGRLALYCAGGLVFFAPLVSGDAARTALVEKMPVGYPNRSLLRRGLDTRSTSQSIQTTAMPRPTTTPKNSNVKPGAVSMVTIYNALQAVYQ